MREQARSRTVKGGVGRGGQVRRRKTNSVRSSSRRAGGERLPPPPHPQPPPAVFRKDVLLPPARSNSRPRRGSPPATFPAPRSGSVAHSGKKRRDKGKKGRTSTSAGQRVLPAVTTGLGKGQWRGKGTKEWEAEEEEEKGGEGGGSSHLIGIDDRAVAIHAEGVFVPEGTLFEEVNLSPWRERLGGRGRSDWLGYGNG